MSKAVHSFLNKYTEKLGEAQYSKMWFLASEIFPTRKMEFNFAYLYWFISLLFIGVSIIFVKVEG